MGFNNLVTNGSIANSDFGYLRSVFLGMGITLNTRLLQNSNLLHLKIWFGFQYNILQATENRIFEDTGNETVLVTYPINVNDNHTYFKNVYFVLPLHLEFDFSKNKKKKMEQKYSNHSLVLDLGWVDLQELILILNNLLGMN